MVLKEKLNEFLDLVANLFTKVEENDRKKLSKLDLAEIFIALLPTAVFATILFGAKVMFTLAVSIISALVTALLWDLVYERKGFKIDYTAGLMAFISGLTLSSLTKPVFVVTISVLSTLLLKTAFRNSKLTVVTPFLIVKAIFMAIFFKSLTIYAVPLGAGTTTVLPVTDIFITKSFAEPAKWLFFGLHSGNIGELSELLVLIGAIYLILRKIINPVIPVFYLATSTLLSFVFKESLPLSLLGGGLFFAAFVLTIDYGLSATPLYKKILYGISCGVLTFLLRRIFGTEGAFLAVLICNAAFAYLSLHNIKRAINFVKNPDFKKLLRKSRKIFGI
jgi:electron transport complex protein RnfD